MTAFPTLEPRFTKPYCSGSPAADKAKGKSATLQAVERYAASGRKTHLDAVVATPYSPLTMKTKYRSSLASIALMGLLSAVPIHADPPSGRITGQVLVLDNQRTLQGDIERKGDFYVIQLGTGQMSLPVRQTLRLCASWEDAFAFMQSQANLHDPDEHLRLANWCDRNGLHAHALAEAARAVEMQPSYSAAKQLLARLQKGPAGPLPIGGHKAPNAPDLAIPPITDLSAECLALFNTRIQPILMNTCATCHASGKGGEFKLLRCEDPTVNRRAAQFNLAAVVAQIHFDRAEASPLLYKSISKHGSMAQAPLQGRDTVPYQMLQEWVHLTVANNPHLRKETAAKLAITAPPAVVAQAPAARMDKGNLAGVNNATAPVVPVVTPGLLSGTGKAAAAVFAEKQSPMALQQNPTEIRQVLHEAQKLRPVAQSEPVGVCDPNDFNAREHPNR